MPATTNDSISAGPALLLAATPVSTKMPVPMVAPTPILVSCSGPSTRRRRPSPAISFRSSSSGFLLNRLLAIGTPPRRVMFSRLREARHRVEVLTDGKPQSTRRLVREAFMDRLDPRGRLDEALAPAIPFLRQSFGFDLLERLAGLHALAHAADGFDEHLVELLQVLHTGQRPVAGDDTRVRRHLGEHRPDVALVAFDVAAALQVNEREHAVEELIAHVDDLGFREIDHTVAVGVAVRHMNDANLFAVEEDRQRV